MQFQGIFLVLYSCNLVLLAGSFSMAFLNCKKLLAPHPCIPQRCGCLRTGLLKILMTTNSGQTPCSKQVGLLICADWSTNRSQEGVFYDLLPIAALSQPAPIVYHIVALVAQATQYSSFIPV
jgi:hypothetical protein